MVRFTDKAKVRSPDMRTSRIRVDRPELKPGERFLCRSSRHVTNKVSRRRFDRMDHIWCSTRYDKLT